MNILFLTLCDVKDLNKNGIYEDVLKNMVLLGHNIVIVSPCERRELGNTYFEKKNGYSVLKVKTGNLFDVGFIEKGISTVLLETQFINAIKKYLSDIKFDLVLYPTPPITLAGVVKFVKDRDNASTYLMLKDIFPQNAIDMGILKKSGIKGFIYRYFKVKEKSLYKISDYIGCMSEANVEYLLKHNRYLKKSKVEICPNSIDPIDTSISEIRIKEIRTKFDLPNDKTLFIYGGNLGKPQGIDFLIECIKNNKNQNAFFVVVGDGAEAHKVRDFVNEGKSSNIKFFDFLPKEEFDLLVAACDVGLIFLDYRFTIPNFPSRLLSYMQSRLPVIAATDPNTDVGKVIENGGFGYSCLSNDVADFGKLIDAACKDDLKLKGDNAFSYLIENYSAEKISKSILSHY